MLGTWLTIMQTSNAIPKVFFTNCKERKPILKQTLVYYLSGMISVQVLCPLLKLYNQCGAYGLGKSCLLKLYDQRKVYGLGNICQLKLHNQCSIHG